MLGDSLGVGSAHRLYHLGLKEENHHIILSVRCQGSFGATVNIPGGMTTPIVQDGGPFISIDLPTEHIIRKFSTSAVLGTASCQVLI